MQTKNILLPLYIADAVMFCAVIFMASPYILTGEVIDFNFALLLSCLVFGAMLLMCWAIYFQYSLAISVEKSASQKNAEKIKSIFGDLRTLRDSLLSQIETNDFLKADVETFNSDLDVLETKIQSISEDISSLNEGLSQLQEINVVMVKIEELEDSSCRLASDFENYKQISNNRISSFLSEISELKTQLENLSSLKNEEITSVENLEENINLESEEEIFDEDTEEYFEHGQPENLEDTKIEYFEDENLDEDDFFENSSDSDEVEEKEFSLEEDDELPQNSKNHPNWSGMIEKALSNSQASITKETVSRFIEKNKTQAESEEDNTQASEGIENTSEMLAELFDESQIESNPSVHRAKSGDTAVIVNSFIGLGNRPYIRGDGMGLSTEKGVELKLLEIGKWQWVCEGLPTSHIKFTLWFNDETPSELGEITLNPGEIVTVDAKF